MGKGDKVKGLGEKREKEREDEVRDESMRCIHALLERAYL